MNKYLITTYDRDVLLAKIDHIEKDDPDDTILYEDTDDPNPKSLYRIYKIYIKDFFKLLNNPIVKVRDIKNGFKIKLERRKYKLSDDGTILAESYSYGEKEYEEIKYIRVLLKDSKKKDVLSNLNYVKSFEDDDAASLWAELVKEDYYVLDTGDSLDDY